jgi:transposase
MKTLSLDLRERILAAYDAGQSTRQSVADRFLVSLGMVKKLLSQRKEIGDIAPRHKNAGRKPKITDAHRGRLRDLVAGRPDMTLEELRAATGLDCTLPAIHYALKAMGLSYKKRLSGRANRTARTSRGGARSGRTT